MYGNDSVFPLSIGNLDNCAPEMREGVTKRELFAALICAGIQANPEGSGSFDAYARDSVKQADALIEALSKEGGRVMEKPQLCPWCNSSDAPNMVCIRCGHQINADSRLKR